MHGILRFARSCQGDAPGHEGFDRLGGDRDAREDPAGHLDTRGIPEFGVFTDQGCITLFDGDVHQYVLEIVGQVVAGHFADNRRANRYRAS